MLTADHLAAAILGEPLRECSQRGIEEVLDDLFGEGDKPTDGLLTGFVEGVAEVFDKL